MIELTREETREETAFVEAMQESFDIHRTVLPRSMFEAGYEIGYDAAISEMARKSGRNLGNG